MKQKENRNNGMHHNDESRNNHNVNKRIGFLENYNKNRKNREHQELRNDEESRNNQNSNRFGRFGGLQKLHFSASIRNNRMRKDINEICEIDEFEKEMVEIEKVIGNKERLILNQRWTENEKNTESLMKQSCDILSDINKTNKTIINDEFKLNEDWERIKNKQIELEMDGICLFNKIIQTETRISNQQYLTSKMLKELKNKK